MLHSPFTDTLPYVAMGAIRSACSGLYRLLGKDAGLAFSKWMHRTAAVDAIVWAIKAAWRTPSALLRRTLLAARAGVGGTCVT